MQTPGCPDGSNRVPEADLQKPAAATAPAAAKAPAVDPKLAEAASEHCKTAMSQLETAQDVVNKYATCAESIVLDPALERTLKVHYIMPLRDGRLAGSGLLLHGPPGSGKSTVAEVLALRCNAALLRVDVASILSRYLGESEQKIKAFIEVAEAYEGPCILLIDEIDSMFSTSASSSVRPVAKQFQTAAEPRRLADAKVVIVGTTNDPDRIPGPIKDRLERVLEVPPPSPTVLQDALRRALPEGHEVDGDQIASLAALMAAAGFRKLESTVRAAANEAAADDVPLGAHHFRQAIIDLPTASHQAATAPELQQEGQQAEQQTEQQAAAEPQQEEQQAEPQAEPQAEQQAELGRGNYSRVDLESQPVEHGPRDSSRPERHCERRSLTAVGSGVGHRRIHGGGARLAVAGLRRTR